MTERPPIRGTSPDGDVTIRIDGNYVSIDIDSNRDGRSDVNAFVGTQGGYSITQGAQFNNNEVSPTGAGIAQLAIRYSEGGLDSVETGNLIDRIRPLTPGPLPAPRGRSGR